MFWSKKSSLELEVTVININAGSNNGLMQKCRELKDYVFFVENVKANEKAGLTRDDAIREAVSYCMKHNVMADYLEERSREVFSMFNWEWNEDEAREAWREEAMEKGRK